MTIKIYNGDGVSKENLKHCYYSLKQCASSEYIIDYISPEEIIRGDWVKDTRLLVLPGGLDIPYTKALNGLGNKIIKKFIKQGGGFLGICAGSYYGGNYVEFAKSTDIEVIGKRELGLFPETVKGPILCDYYYNSDRGAKAAEIIIENNIIEDCHVFYNGGGYFVNAENTPNTKIIARYNTPDLQAAIIKCQYGKGTAILSGVHFEYDPNLMKQASIQKIADILKQEDHKRVALVKYLLEILH
ncbi:MAG: BPL-N domain-containing protein [Candidatus Rickettsia vulgarisii]